MRTLGVMLIIGLLMGLGCVPGSAQTPTNEPAQSATGPDAGDLWTRATLTGDWGGFRDTLAAKGITVTSDVTQVVQSVVSGGREAGWQYQGRGQATLTVDTQKLGL
jgi:carbohydrate-selective porin OprB